MTDRASLRWRQAMLVASTLLWMASAAVPQASGSIRAPAVANTVPADLIVVDLEARATAAKRAILADGRLSVVAHLGPQRWLVAGRRAALDGIPGVVATAPWRPADGVAFELRDLAAAVAGEAGREILVIAAVAPGTKLTDLRRRLEKSGAQVSWFAAAAAPAPQIGLRVAGSGLSSLIAELDQTPELVWAEAQAPVRLLNSASVWRCQSGVPDETPIFERGLRGQGQIIGVMDTGIDIDDCRFDDPVAGLPALNQADGTEVNQTHRKVLAVDFHWGPDWPPLPGSWDDHGHGTHVAGSAAGDELANGTFDDVDGMAPAARLVVQDGGAQLDDCADLPGLGCPVKPLGPVLEQARAQGARIHTNSWGDEENILPHGRYTERTADVDRFTWQYKDTLVMFAAGNSGPVDATVISPAVGKNVVAVGATLHGDFSPPCVVEFSSRGWSRDGRIKPDVVAPGTFVVSAATSFAVPDPSCGNATRSGTSMAAPTAAGLAALVRQYFTDGFYPSGAPQPGDSFEPSAALVKAMLIASGVDLSALGCDHEPIPSRDQGWGLIQLDTVLAFEGGDRGLVVDDRRNGFTSSGDEPVRRSVVVGETGPLKVVLVWTDAPSSSLATINLVNDLDLTLRGPDGVYAGNDFVAGVSVKGGDPDRRNNVEVVWLPEAEQGVWTIEVAPHAVAVPDQDFALVITGAVQPVSGPRRSAGRVTP